MSSINRPNRNNGKFQNCVIITIPDGTKICTDRNSFSVVLNSLPWHGLVTFPYKGQKIPNCKININGLLKK